MSSTGSRKIGDVSKRAQLHYAKMRAGLPLIEVRDWILIKKWPPGNKAWPVSGDPKSNGTAPFFILGSPRSGTTLLRAILQGHGEVFIPPENGTLGSMVKVAAQARSQPWKTLVDRALAEFVQGYEYAHWNLDLGELRARGATLPHERRTLAGLISMIYETYGELHAPGRPRWGDKSTPGSFHYLYRLSLVFPHARFLHLIRDGRACVASSVRAGFFDRDYVLSARAWKANVSACRRLGRRIADPRRFLEIHYEDLVENPGESVDKICGFLGLRPDPAMLAHTVDVARRIPEITQVAHHENVGKSIFRSSLRRWQEDIPPKALRRVQKILTADLVAYGYELRPDCRAAARPRRRRVANTEN